MAMATTDLTGPDFGTRTVIPGGVCTERLGRGMFETRLDFALVGEEAVYPCSPPSDLLRMANATRCQVEIGVHGAFLTEKDDDA
jgi:hypothetical protein